MLQHRRGLIDPNPNLILFLRGEVEVRTYPRARARIAHPADGVPFFPFSVFFHCHFQLGDKNFSDRLGRVPFRALGPLQARVVARKVHAGARCLMHHLRAFSLSVKEAGEIEDIVRSSWVPTAGPDRNHENKSKLMGYPAFSYLPGVPLHCRKNLASTCLHLTNIHDGLQPRPDTAGPVMTEPAERRISSRN